jgi:hypothetical protein
MGEGGGLWIFLNKYILSRCYPYPRSEVSMPIKAGFIFERFPFCILFQVTKKNFVENGSIRNMIKNIFSGRFHGEGHWFSTEVSFIKTLDSFQSRRSENKFRKSQICGLMMICGPSANVTLCEFADPIVFYLFAD